MRHVRCSTPCHRNLLIYASLTRRQRARWPPGHRATGVAVKRARLLLRCDASDLAQRCEEEGATLFPVQRANFRHRRLGPFANSHQFQSLCNLRLCPTDIFEDISTDGTSIDDLFTDGGTWDQASVCRQNLTVKGVDVALFSLSSPAQFISHQLDRAASALEYFVLEARCRNRKPHRGATARCCSTRIR